MYWTQQGNLKEVKLLVEKGVKLNISDDVRSFQSLTNFKNGVTPLHRAVHSQYYEMTEYLLIHGASPDLPEKGDVSDWITNGGTKEKLLEIINNTSEWTEDTQTKEKPLLSLLLKWNDILTLDVSV